MKSLSNNNALESFHVAQRFEPEVKRRTAKPALKRGATAPRLLSARSKRSFDQSGR